jgi:predicted enzyme related to lactoylglutathione lyase
VQLLPVCVLVLRKFVSVTPSLIRYRQKNQQLYNRLYFGRITPVTKAFVSHVEWCCRDIETTAKFFQSLFDWQFKPFGNNYLLCNPAQGPAVGLLRTATATPGDSCLVFVTVDNIEKYSQQAATLGGSVYVEKTAIPDYGWYAQIKEPQGNIVGMFEGLEARG